MGAILDSAKDLWQDKKNPSRQAHKTKAELEKEQDKGVKWQKRNRHQNQYWKGLM